MSFSQEPLDIGIVSRKKVLVAEDEVHIASLIDDWLSDSFEVIIAANGTAALQKAKWNNPDIILMDVVMPDMGGYEVIRALRSDTATNQIPIIAMSAQNFDDSTIKLIKGEANVMGFLNKPFKPDVLKSTIERVLSGERTLSSVTATETTVAQRVSASFVDEVVTPPETMPEQPVPVAVNDPPSTDRVPAPEPSAPPSPEPAAPVAEPEPSEPEPPPPTARPRETMRAPLPPKPRPTPPPEPSDLDEPESSWFWGFIRFCFKLGFFLLSLVIIGEVACRLTERSFGVDLSMPPVRTAQRATSPFEFKPGTAWERNGVLHRFNSWGMRDAEVSLARSTDTYRILLLGGTMTFGEGIEQSQTVAKVLERLLNQQLPFPGYTRCEVLNGGLWGFSPKDQWEFFERIGGSLEPNVLLWLVENDDSPRSLWVPDRVPPALSLWLRNLHLLWLALHQVHVARVTDDSVSTVITRAHEITAEKRMLLIAVSALPPNSKLEATLGIKRLPVEELGFSIRDARLPAVGHRWLAQELLEMLKTKASAEGEGR